MATTSTTVRTTQLPNGEAVGVLGQGSWHFAETRGRREEEIAAVRLGIDLGMTLIDTAEMYGAGAAEELIGEAIAGRRDEVFIVDKVLPNHATQSGTVVACERSLARLDTDRIDLYLLHWRGSVALEQTLAGFETLLKQGKIRQWGVSNFDVSDMQELEGLRGGNAVATNQVLYNLTRRGVEYSLLPWCRQRAVPIMAYSPIEQGRLLTDPTIQRIAARHQATPAQIALAWLLRQEGVITIPKMGTTQHVQENHAALKIQLQAYDLEELDNAFAPPGEKTALEML